MVKEYVYSSFKTTLNATKMKNISLFLMALLSVFSIYAQDLQITGVIDATLTGGLPKAVELQALNNIPDLSIYGLGSANNGGGSDGQEYTFPNDSLQAGDFIYVSNENAQFLSFFGFAPTYINNASTAVNGDDAVELFMNGNVIDTFGFNNIDGSGKSWEYTNGWAKRTQDGPDATFQESKWTIEKGAFNNTTTNANASKPFQVGGSNGGGGTPVTLITINQARQANLNSIVQITGTLTATDHFGSGGTAFIQDKTGAIAIYDLDNVHGDGLFEIGDSITITGTRAEFRTLQQIKNVTNVVSHGKAIEPIQPRTILLSQLNDYPAELVKVMNPTFPNPTDLIFGQSNYTLTDTSGNGDMRIDGDVTSIIGLAQPIICSEVIGVIGKYESNPQLLPRLKADLPCANTYVAPTNPTSFVNQDKTADIVTWNIEWFGDDNKKPDSDLDQKNSVKQIIQDLNPDLIAVQEIVDEPLFSQLVSELNGYAYVLSTATTNNSNPAIQQKIGFIYKTSVISKKSTKAMFTDIHPNYNGGDESALSDYPAADKSRFYSGGRLPFLMTADVTIDNKTKEIDFIALHARANSSNDAQLRYDMRKYDVTKLKERLDADYSSKNIVLLGDFNDDVDETVADGVTARILAAESSYAAFVNDPTNYKIVTSPLSSQGKRSYISRDNMIDHIIISDELIDNYLLQSEQVHYEVFNSNYGNTTSDHMPVSARISVVKAQLLLPIDLVHFYAMPKENDIIIEFQTAQEIPSAQYVIEYSLNGIHFSPLIKTNGNKTEYQFVHKNVMNIADNLYYRIKQINQSDEIDYSEIIQVRTNQKPEITIYPNPVMVGESVIISSSKPIDSYTVYTSTGQVVLSKKETNTISTKTLKKGLYIIQFSDGQIQKFIVK